MRRKDPAAISAAMHQKRHPLRSGWRRWALASVVGTAIAAVAAGSAAASKTVYVIDSSAPIRQGAAIPLVVYRVGFESQAQCDAVTPGGIGDNAVGPMSNVYLLPAGGASVGMSLGDLDYETLAGVGTLPGGFLPRGGAPRDYDVVIDECQDGILDTNDAIYGPDGPVVDTPDNPSPTGPPVTVPTGPSDVPGLDDDPSKLASEQAASMIAVVRADIKVLKHAYTLWKAYETICKVGWASCGGAALGIEATSLASGFFSPGLGEFATGIAGDLQIEQCEMSLGAVAVGPLVMRVGLLVSAEVFDKVLQHHQDTLQDWHADPLDPNYVITTDLAPPTLAPPSSDPVDAALGEILVSASLEANSLEALTHANERMLGAEDVGAYSWALQHAHELDQYATEAAAASDDNADALRGAAD